MPTLWEHTFPSVCRGEDNGRRVRLSSDGGELRKSRATLSRLSTTKTLLLVLVHGHQVPESDDRAPSRQWKRGVADAGDQQGNKDCLSSLRGLESHHLSYLRTYRDSPHPASQETPNMLMFGRSCTSRLSQFTKGEIDVEMLRAKARARGEVTKERINANTDKRRRASHRPLQMGDRVFGKQKKRRLASGVVDNFIVLLFFLANFF